MIDESAVSYRHTQKAPWHYLLDAIGVGLLVTALLSNEPPDARWLMVGLGTLFLLLGASFQHLTLEDQGDHFDIHFGPLPLFRRRIRYERIRQIEVGRTMILDSWGIHWSLRGGWVWSVWGRDCVVIRLERGTLRVGTDDVANLAAFLRSRLGRSMPEDPPDDPFRR